MAPAGMESPADATHEDLVVLPVHDERQNLEVLLPRLLGFGFSVLVIEDASSDGSSELLADLASQEPRLEVVHRQALLGLGSAYVLGFERALETGARRIVQMDADLSHDAEALPSLLAALDESDLVVGSRYLPGGEAPGWSSRRRVLSRLGGLYTRFWTRLPYSDPTSGFRAFRAQALRRLELPSIRSQGFAFQVEVLARAHAAGLRICEVPITFRERVHGRSKLSSRIVLEALWTVPRLRRASILPPTIRDPQWTALSSSPSGPLGARRSKG